MRHIVKMKGWPGHDIELTFEDADDLPGDYRDHIEVTLDGKPLASLNFTARDRDDTKPTLKVMTEMVMGTWSNIQEYDLIPAKEDPE